MAVSRRSFLEILAVGAGFGVSTHAQQTQKQWTPNWISGQPGHIISADQKPELQPFAQQVRELETTLEYLGQPFTASDRGRINSALNLEDDAGAVVELAKILDPYVLLTVNINPESRVEVMRGGASAELIEAGTRLFLVEVHNQAGITAPLEVHSPNSQPVYVSAWKDESPEPSERVTVEDIRNRWADISLYKEEPFTNRLSGLTLQYAILQIYSRDSGARLARISFEAGPGTQDIGSHKDLDILFHAKPARTVRLRVADDDGSATTASFLFRDNVGRIYPNPSKRLAPDFFFQPQVYRADGESIRLPDGSYEVTCTGGPEYVSQVRRLEVAGESEHPIPFQLKRWIHPAKAGWHPGDHHIHAAGCSHYVTPTEGVDPAVMMRQVEGEHLSVGCVLNWAPCYYHQKQFFTARDNPLSKPDRIMHYDLEVSGFPSSHCGHLVLLGLNEQNYPGTKRIEDWPTWNLPILQWAKAQGAIVGYPHSGWGLAVKSQDLPNFEMPAFDGIGANEYIVDVTHPNSVDFVSAGDTPYVWELNIWYHALNVGFRTRLSGETDFPCITDNRVGQGRLYGRVDGPLTYGGWLSALKNGRSYVSNGKSHLMDFCVNGVGLGTGEVQLATPGTAEVMVRSAAYLNAVPDLDIAKLPYDKEPYWDIERARIAGTRKVPVELIWNGRCIAQQQLLADGSMQTLRFTAPIQESGWIALRILPSSHTNPIFVNVRGTRMKPSRASAEWCLVAVDQCWSQKVTQISATEAVAAKSAYDHARQTYRKLMVEGV